MADIKEGHEEYQSLYAMWLGERKPGWLTHGTKFYRVFQDSETNKPFFREEGSGIDSGYSSRSTEGIIS